MFDGFSTIFEKQNMAAGTQDVTKEASVEEILKDFLPGPLDLYRKKASFDWKQMKLFIEGEEVLKFKVWLLLAVVPKKPPTTNNHGGHSYCNLIEPYF